MRGTKIIILWTLIFSCFISCNNLADIRVENTESNSQENIELTEESSNKQFAKLYINLQGRGRTILPSDPEVSMLSNFSLSGNIKGEEEKNLGTWRNLESLQKKSIILEPGNWEFYLTASKDSSKYSGNVDVVLHKGDNQINFELKRIDDDNGSGNLSFTLDFSNAEEPEIVALAIAHIENIDGSIIYDNKDLEILDNSINYTEFSIPAGSYRLCITLYADLEGTIVLANYKEIIKIASSLVSQKTYKLNSFKNLYHINYHFNDTEAYPATFTENVQEIFIASTGKIALPTPKRAGGWSFNGWYLDKNCTLPVSEIDSSCISDVDVYADWDFDIDLWIGDHAGQTIHRGEIFLYDSEEKTNYTKYDTFVKANSNVYEFYVDYYNFNGLYELAIDYEQDELDPSIQVSVINETKFLQDSTEEEIIITATALDNRTKVYKIHATPVYNCRPKFQFRTDGIYYSSHTNAKKIDYIGKKGDYDWFLFSCTDGNYKVYSDEVISIEESTFEGYSTLEEITIPNSIKTIGKNAFSGCTNLNIINYLGTLKDWCSIDFESVYSNPISFGGSLYINEEPIKEIIIPEDIETISNFAFYRYSYLESIVIPGSVNEIGEQVFSQCRNLSEVVISDGVESIGKSAFSHVGIKSLEIPGSVKTIGLAAFWKCTSLNEVILHEGIESIENQAFSGTSITTVKLPSSITYLGSGGSYSHPFGEIESVIISDGTTKIWDNAFNGCTKLTHVEIPDSVTEIGDSAFVDTKLSDLTFLNKISKIGKRAFAGCENLVTIIIPDNVKEIPSGAFNNCPNLRTVTISDKVNKIDANFFGCKQLEEVYFEGSLDDWMKLELTDSFLFDNNDVIISGEINRNTKLYIDNCDVSTITKISIPYGVTTVRAFQKFTNLVEISMPDSVVEIRETSFAGCEKLSVINFSKNLKMIGASAFRNCKSLNNISLPDNSLEIIGGGAFSDCSSLTSFVVPGSVTNLGDLFSGCSKLSEITLQDGVKSISGHAFCNVYDIGGITLTIPVSCISIANNAFYGKGYWVHYNGSIEQWKEAINNEPLISGYYSSLTIKCTDGDFKWEH